ncbi:hypothetical protein BO71DRAFT_443055 [Aspergillus ellipticus CBS 707.79]|uniref:Uncharacterized protein n=1 Tax=Aspergillus ellipticus CBS 707.79 TaxID=1448320 RepID=A0A319D370_9EURO|nr:hypothetical protein BO71DRAFT_443055 [Aspergillus ellipticus CBS 707.79]
MLRAREPKTSARCKSMWRNISALNSILTRRESSTYDLDELRDLGIHPVEVELCPSERQALKFEPCFFIPQFPPTLLSDYPIFEDVSESKCLSVPDSTTEEEDEEADYPEGDGEEREEETESPTGFSDTDTDTTEEYLGDDPRYSLDMASSAQWTIRHHYNMYRSGLDDVAPAPFSVFGVPKDFEYYDYLYDFYWRVSQSRFFMDQPHCVIELIEDTTSGAKYLTRGEMLCVLRAMLGCLVYDDRPSFYTMPILLLTFFPDGHGRILQAHHDGNVLVLQYSPMICDIEKEDISIALFLRILSLLH